MDKVPGEVVRALGRGRTIVPITKLGSKELSKKFYLEKTNDVDAAYLPNQQGYNLLELLSPWDYEDLIGIWLQRKFGYYMIAQTRGPNTPRYEFGLVREKNVDKSEFAYVQVKSAVLNVDEYSEDKDELFLFSCSGHYVIQGKVFNEVSDGDKLVEFRRKHQNIHIINKDELAFFMEQDRNILPRRVQSLVQLAKDHKAKE